MTAARSVAARDLKVAGRFAKRLADEHDAPRFRVVLVGSRAGGDEDEESDLDLSVAVDGDDRDGGIKAAAWRIACDLTLEHGVLISVFVADREFLERHRDFSFVKAVEHEDGVSREKVQSFMRRGGTATALPKSGELGV